MVRRSVLVYDLLRTEQPPDGFSQKEILTHISDKYDIAAGKTLQRDVAVALRRGLDFGILAKRRNKFRFDPDFHQTTSLKRNIAGRNARKKKRKRSGKKKAANASTTTKGRRQRRRRRQQKQQCRRRTTSRGKTRKSPSASVPRPKLPNPPSWSPKRRYLADEPMPKVIKHS